MSSKHDIALSPLQQSKDIRFLTDVVSLWFKIQRDVFSFENFDTYESMKDGAAKLVQTFMIMSPGERDEQYGEFLRIYDELSKIADYNDYILCEKYLTNNDDDNNYSWIDSIEEKQPDTNNNFRVEKYQWYDGNVWNVEEGKWWDDVWENLNENSDEKLVWNEKFY